MKNLSYKFTVYKIMQKYWNKCVPRFSSKNASWYLFLWKYPCYFLCFKNAFFREERFPHGWLNLDLLWNLPFFALSCAGNVSQKSIEDFWRLLKTTLKLENCPKITIWESWEKTKFWELRLTESTKLSRFLKISYMHSVISFWSHFINKVPVSQSIYHHSAKRTFWNIFAINSKSNTNLFNSCVFDLQ